jgi:hypothetical protein
MTTYHVYVSVQILEIYEVEADDADSAEDNWADGSMIAANDQSLPITVLSVREARP